MAEQSEFMKGFRSFQRQKDKPPPIKRQDAGAPKATPQQVFKPQEHKRSAFTDSFFKYQDMMNKELERINKEAEKAEQDIIKQQMGQPGAGIQLGAPELAQEGLSPEMGTTTPPSGLESLYQQSVPQDLQATAFPQPGAQQVEAPPTPPGPPVPTATGSQITDIYGAVPEEGREQMGAVGELGAAFGTGAAAFLPSMLGGYLEGTIPTVFPQVGVPPQPYREKLTSKEKVEAVTQVQDTIAEELSYVPRTAGGRELTEFASWPFQKVQQFATWASENIVPESQPFLRKITDDTIHLGTYIVAHKTGRLSAKAFKEGVAKVRGIPKEKVTVANTEVAIKSAQDKLPKKIKKDTTEFLKNVKEEVTENLKGRPEFTEVEMIAIELAREQGGPQAAKFLMDELVARKKPPAPVEKVKEPAPVKAPPKAPVPKEKVVKPAPETVAKELGEKDYRALGEKAGLKFQSVYKTEKGDLISYHDPRSGGDFSVPKSELTEKTLRVAAEKKKAELPKLTEEEKRQRQETLEAERRAKELVPPKPRTEAEMKTEVEAAGAIWGAVKEGKIDTTPWPATKTHPEGLRNFNSPYTESTLTITPSKITVEAVKSKMFTNYVETKKAGGEIKKIWKEGEDAFAQQSVEGVKPKAEIAKTEPTPPPAKVGEILDKETHKVKSGTKEEVAEEFRTRAKSAPESLSDVPKDQPTWIQVDHEGTIFTMANTADALNFFADKISKLKKKRIEPVPLKTKPPSPPKASGKRPKVDVDAGETYTRIFDKDTKFKTPRESEVWHVKTEGERTYLYRSKYKGQTFYSDGSLLEFRDATPKVKVSEFVEPPEGMTKSIGRIEESKFQSAKPVFDTEIGVAIMNKESGFFISHNYFDYVRSKYGPNVKWEIPLPDSGNPIKFSVNGKLQGYIAPFNPKSPHLTGLVGTPHNLLAERFPKGFGPGLTFEAGGLQTMYEGVRDVIKSVKFPESAYMKAKGVKEFVKEEMVDPLRFYPDLPKEYVNDVRVHMVAALDRARHKVYSKEGHAGRIFKDMKKGEIYDTVELIYARDEVGRQKAGRGNPELTLEEVTKIRDGLEKSASAEVLRATEEWRAVTEEVQTDLVRRGVLKEGQFIEDYAPHAVGVYTPDWAYTVGIPTRIRTPFRSFKQKARGTTKEIVKDSDTLLGHLLKVEHTNMIEDFIIKETAKYDIIPTFTKDQKIALFGSRAHERLIKSKAHPEGIMKEVEVVNTPKPGRIWLEEELVKVDPTYKGKGDFWSYTPDQPFSRTIFMTEEGQMALGRYKNVSLIPADIFRSFKSFSESGSALIHKMNLITSYWKSMAILSHYPSFNMNNLIGDTFMAAIQHPRPARLLIEMETSLKYLMGEARAKPHTGYLKELNDFILSEDILGASFFQTELPRQLTKTKNPLRMILDKSMTVSQMREGINRTAYASTLLKSMKEGRGKEMIKAHSWIDTKGLSEQAALGKIAREVLVDYAAVSKGFRRIGRGLLTPFGCVDDKTECLTERGWKKHDELKWREDKIWSFDPIDDKCKWTLLEGAYVDQYEGEMVEIKSKSYRAFLTPCHSCLVKVDGKYKTMRAEDLLVASINTQLPVVLDLKKNKVSYETIGSAKESHYKGVVWCPKTGTGYWLARRGNNVFITGNTWYFHNSLLIHKWMWKNKGKALISLLGPPLIAQAWNNRNEEARLREQRRPDWIRNKIHFDIDETAAGDARTWALQLPQDVLIGTKVFTIATDMGSRVYRKEINPATGKAWTPRDAALRTIKEWGMQEYRGVAYLMAPLIRFYVGLKDRRDPYDKAPIYSTDYNKLNPMQRKWEGAQFFLKTMVPFLGANIIKTQQKKQPIDIAFRDFLDNFVGKEAIGIFDITSKGEIRLGNGKVYTMDDTARIKWVSNQNLQHFNDLERAYIGFRGSNQEFVQSDKFNKVLVEMYDDMGRIDPKLFKPELENEVKTGIISQFYGERLVNMLIDPGTQQNRMDVQIKRAKTDEEKRAIRKDFEKQREARIFMGLRRQPKAERELMLKRKMDGSELPWQLELYMPP